MFTKTCGFTSSGLVEASTTKKRVTRSFGLRHSTKMFISQSGTARYAISFATCPNKFTKIYRPDRHLRNSTKTMLFNPLCMMSKTS